MNKLKLAALSTLLASSFAIQSQAHGIWVADRHDNLAIVYGDGSDEGYKPEKVVSLSGKKADMSAGEITRNDQDDHILFTAADDTAYITAEFVSGHWSQDKDEKWHNVPKDQLEGALKGGYYVKYTTGILKNLGALPQLQNHTLEILALVDPTTLKMGDYLPVQVYFQGNPLADAELIADYVTDRDNKLKTDSKGYVTIKVRNNGLNVLAINHNQEVTGDPKADKYGYFSTLSFVAASD
ncbi:MAG TPA: hypothetical protein DD729_01165 [Rhodobacteraceae bacterium]|nr:hypothetical protein [Paracoccaceae bacterium]